MSKKTASKAKTSQASLRQGGEYIRFEREILFNDVEGRWFD